MRNHSLIARVLLIVPMLVWMTIAGIAQNAPTKPITEKGLRDAIRIGGLEESELIAAIDARGVDFVLTVQIEQSLRSVGASDNILHAVRDHYRGAVLPPPPPPPVHKEAPVADNAASAVPANPGIYLRNGSGWAPLPMESINWAGSGLLHGLHKASAGLLKEQIAGEVAGVHSEASAHAPASFAVRLAPGASIGSYLLLHLHGKHDNREFKAGSGGERSNDEVAFETIKTADGSYEIVVSQGSGEYAFVLRNEIPREKGAGNSGRARTFRILE